MKRICRKKINLLRHAPRERVSWNGAVREYVSRLLRHAPRERVSWNSSFSFVNPSCCVTLHVSVWVEINQMLVSVYLNSVTLHVSVWVEIKKIVASKISEKSRSTWACELKCFKVRDKNLSWRHAPRERVSWNCITKHCSHINGVTLHVSVWVEMFISLIILLIPLVTLHVSVWVEMSVIVRNAITVIVTLHVSVWVEISTTV